MNEIEKWTPTPADSQVPPQIARLSKYYSLDSFDADDSKGTHANLSGLSNEDNLESIKSSIAALRPYLVMREFDRNHEVEVLEMSLNGVVNGRSTRNMKQIISMLRKNSLNIEARDSRLNPDVKAEIAKYIRDIQLQDLRYFKYELCNSYEEPNILIRKHAVVLSMNPIRAIFTADKVFLIGPVGSDSLLYMIQEHIADYVTLDTDLYSTPSTPVTPALASRRDSSGIPELVIVRAMFSITLGLQAEELNKATTQVEALLRRLKSNAADAETGSAMPLDIQDNIQMVKEMVSKQSSRIQSYIRLFQDMSTNESSLALMNLSLLKRNPQLYIKPLEKEILANNEELIVVMQANQVDFTSLGIKLSYLESEINNAEVMMSLKLDTARNQLLMTDMTLATVSLSITVANFVLGIFGMNLYSAIEHIWAGFFWILSLVLLLAVVVGSRRLLVFFNLSDNRMIRKSN